MVGRWCASRALIDIVAVIALSVILSFYKRNECIRIIEEEVVRSTLSDVQQAKLREIALKLMETGKGILAADESIGTMDKRFATVRIENNAENRKNYRQALFTAVNISKHISGIILHEETFYQKDDNGIRLVDIINEAGVLAGIKLDKGLKQLDNTPEYITAGLNDLAERAAFFKKGGCHFAKWRCVYVISEFTPSHNALRENAKILAQFAVLSQRSALVPVIEPEVICDGKHDLEKAEEVTERVLAEVYKSLHDYGVYLEGTLLKPNMVLPGMNFPEKVGHDRIASATLKALLRTVPAAVPGIVFLSGGQSEKDATTNLNEINKSPVNKPWKISFSYGRALQTSALKAWKEHGRKEAQAAFLYRSELNGLAAEGRYLDELV